MKFILYLMIGIGIVSCSGSVSDSISTSPFVTGSPTDQTIALTEGQSYQVRVLLSKPLVAAVSLNWNINSSDASTFSKLKSYLPFTSNDFSPMSGTVNLAAESTEVIVTINSLADDIFEGIENYEFQLTGSTLSGVVKIPIALSDATTSPILDYTHAHVTAGNPAQLVFTLNRRSSRPIEFDLVLHEFSARAGLDYTIPTSLRQVIPANQLTYSLPITTLVNSSTPGDKRLGVSIDNLTHAIHNSLSRSIFIIPSTAPVKVNITPTLTVNESLGEAELTVSLVDTNGDPFVATEVITLDWETRSGIAQSGVDFAQVNSQQLVIPVGVSSVVLRVPLIDDSLNEEDETFKVLIGNVRGGSASLGQYESTVTIQDNDDSPTVQWTVASQNVLENIGSVSIRAQLSAVSGKDIMVAVNQDSASTVTASDHNFSATTLIIPKGQIFAEQDIQIANDTLAAGLKTLILDLSAPNNATLAATGRETINIIDDDGAPTLFIGNATVNESIGLAQIPVSLGSGIELGESVEFDWVLSPNLATTPEDFVATPQRVVVNGPANSVFLPITILDDSIYEGSEQFSILLQNASGNASIISGAATGYITIIDNESQPEISFQLLSQSISELTSTAMITVELTATSASAVLVPFTITGTATIDDDYNLGSPYGPNDLSGVISIAPNSLVASLPITIINDALNEENETIVVNLGPPTGASLGAQRIHTLTIQDNDTVPTLNIADSTVTEGQDLVFNVTLSGASGQDVTANYIITPASAQNPRDFTGALAGSVTVLPGSLMGQVRIATVDNTIFDGNRQLTVTLSNLSGAIAGELVATGTINDNEIAPTISLSDAAALEGQNLVFQVSLTHATNQDVTITYSTQDGDNANSLNNALVSDNDYTPLSNQTVTIPMGQLTADINIASIQDSKYESNEQFKVVISSPSPALVITDATGIGTIQNEDTAPILQFAIPSQSIIEDAGTVSVSVTLAQAQSIATTVDFTVTGTATSGTDFSVTTSSPLTFAVGETLKTIAVSITDDNLVEISPETIILTLSNASSHVVLGTQNTHTITISDNDTSAVISSFNLPSSNQTAMPTSVVVTYSKAMNTASVENISNWSYSCTGSGTGTITSVSYTSQQATVNLNTTVQPTNGSACTLTALTLQQDVGNNDLTGALSTRQVVYSKVAPASVVRVTSTTSNDWYKAGDMIQVQVEFSEAVIVTGTPQLMLETGTTDAVVNLISGTGTTTLSGSFQVQAGYSTADLNYPSTNSLILNGGTILAQSNSLTASIELPATNHANSLAEQKQIGIDTTNPSAPSNLVDGQFSASTTTSPTITFTNGADALSGLLRHEARITRADNSVVQDWAVIANNSTISGLTLLHNTQYFVELRAVDNAGNLSNALIGDGWTVDTMGPNTVTGLSLGSNPNNLTESPAISWTATTDFGASGVSHYQVQVRTGGTVVKDWTTHISSNPITSGLSLTNGVEYYIRIRAVDNVGNFSITSDSVTWSATLSDLCLVGTPSPGTVCESGAIYLGTLSPGATSGSGTDKYMTTPGGCEDIPAGSISGGNGTSSYASSDFTPNNCSGVDSLRKTWNDGTLNWYDILGLINYTGLDGSTHGEVNLDANYGDSNTNNIISITSGAQGGYHAAARYCDKLNLNGYTDWYLPNRAELNLMWTNSAYIPGLRLDGNWYHSSTEHDATHPRIQRFSDGNQWRNGKHEANFIRCVRRIDELPNMVEFLLVNNASLNQDLVSNVVEISGVEVPVIASVDGNFGTPLISKSTDNGNTWSSWTSSVNVFNGDKIRLKVSVGNVVGQLYQTTVLIGKLSTYWSVYDSDPCMNSPQPGTICPGGAIFLGSLSAGATSANGVDDYMITSGGCGDIPVHLVSGGTGATTYTEQDFTPICSGSDTLFKSWNNGTGNWYDIPNLTNFTTTAGVSNGLVNLDNKYGEHNTSIIAIITSGAQGGYHAAARYCDKLNLHGFTDWHLPNRAELNLIRTNKSMIPGIDQSSGNWYWSSTEYDNNSAWVQRFNDDYQNNYTKSYQGRVRCVRKIDKTPDPVIFNSVESAPLNQDLESNLVTISGLAVPVIAEVNSSLGSPRLSKSSDGGSNWSSWSTSLEVFNGDQIKIIVSIGSVPWALYNINVTIGGYKTTWVAIDYSSVCPENYVFVSHLEPYTQNFFCVAKYEMKNVGGVATSQALGLPWANIPRGVNSSSEGSAWKACKDIGVGFDLITNAQWQTIARNLEGVGFNWSEGSLGQGTLSLGSNNLAEASTDDNSACLGTGTSCDLNTWNLYRRVYKLSSGDYLWDISGNVTEWVQDNNTTVFTSNHTNIAVMSEALYPTMGVISGVNNTAKYHFGPAGDYSQNPSFGYLGFGWLDNYAGTNGSILRGGGYHLGTYGGIFKTMLWYGPTYQAPHAGFRCVWTP